MIINGTDNGVLYVSQVNVKTREDTVGNNGYYYYFFKEILIPEANQEFLTCECSEEFCLDQMFYKFCSS